MNSIAQRIENIASNMEAVKDRLILPAAEHAHSIQLVCYGPSLQRTWELIDRTRPILTVSGAHDFLKRRGITPTYHVEFDWRPHKALGINDPKGTVFWLASCVHPEVRKKCPNPVLWHAEQSLEEGKFIKKREREAFLVPGGSSAGLRAIDLLIALGYGTFDIHGMDSSFEGKTEHAGPHFGTAKLSRDVLDVLAGQRTFKTSIAFLQYMQEFVNLKTYHKGVKFNLWGDGLLQHHIASMEKASV